MAEQPRFFLVLGPSGAGKSTAFDGKLGVDSLNRDRLLQKLSPHGDTRFASREAKMIVRHEENEFIRTHLSGRKSFATERTFVYASELERVDQAKAKGFQTTVLFVAAGDADNHVRRAQGRVLEGGHRVAEGEIRDIHERSMRNLPLLFEAAAEGRINRLTIYDNSSNRGMTQLIDVYQGNVIQANPKAPEWLRDALDKTNFSIGALRQAKLNNTPLKALDVDGPQRRKALAVELNAVDVLAASPLARQLGAERVMNDMQDTRESLLLGVPRKSILSEIAARTQSQPRGAKAYAEAILETVEEQTGWTPKEPRKPAAQTSSEEIAVRLTDTQAQLLIAESSPGNQDQQRKNFAAVLAGDKAIAVFDGRAELAFSPQSNTLYAVLDRNDKERLDQRLTSLQQQRGAGRAQEGRER